jgi:hypothetical protein
VADATTDRILATGGAAPNAGILQVMADVFDAEVYVLDGRVTPVPQNVAVYTRLRQKYSRTESELASRLRV